MVCKGDVCLFDGTPKPRYKWWAETRDTGYVCALKPIKILGKEEDSKLFGRNCTADHLNCK